MKVEGGSEGKKRGREGQGWNSLSVKPAGIRARHSFGMTLSSLKLQKFSPLNSSVYAYTVAITKTVVINKVRLVKIIHI